MKLDDIFEPIVKGDFGLTDEAVYQSFGGEGEIIPLYGGNQSHTVPVRWVKTGCITTKGKSIHPFTDLGIILSLDGSAGSMTYKDGSETFALNHHAGFLKPLESAVDAFDAEFFAVFFQNRLRSMAVSDGSKTLSISQLQQFTFTLPPLSVQHDLLKKYRDVSTEIKALNIFTGKMGCVLDKQISSTYRAYQVQNIPIRDVIDCMSGNSGLTEELIYNKSNAEGTRYQVLSASTIPDTAMGYIPKSVIPTTSGKKRELNTFEGKDGLLVVRKGKAGGTKYLPEGKYMINDDAYILSVMDDCPYQIDLRWLAIACKTDFLAYASNSDNGTWNKTGFFDNVTIDIPSHEEQERLVETVEKALRYKRRLDEAKHRLDDLLTKEIDIPE